MQKPLPRFTQLDREFWEAAQERRLILQRCQSTHCNRHVFYPRVCCPFCGSGDLRWESATGNGRIASYSFVCRPQHESFYAEAPLCFIAVELNEGPIIYSELRPRPDAGQDLLGRPVRAIFLEHAKNQRLPYFELAE